LEKNSIPGGWKSCFKKLAGRYHGDRFEIENQQLPVSAFGMSFFSILCVNDFCMVVFCVFIADLATKRDDAGAI
jgi:hypothetical protein